MSLESNSFFCSEQWHLQYPTAAIGVLALDHVANPAEHAALAQRKTELEEKLRDRFAGYDRAALRSEPVLAAYHAYYKRFKKSYHVQLQLESILFKGKSLPHVAALVEAMFMAELNNRLLTAGHDLDVVTGRVGVYVAQGGEQYTGIGAQKLELKAGDMYIADQKGVLSSVLYGPDRRTRITPETSSALFTVYAPPGIPESAMRQHLQEIADLARMIAPEAKTTDMAVHVAG